MEGGRMEGMNRGTLTFFKTHPEFINKCRWTWYSEQAFNL